MRKLFRTYLFGWLRKTNSISRYLELHRGAFRYLSTAATPEENLRLLREIKRLERGIRRVGRL